MYAFVDVADYQKVVVSDSSLGIDVAVKKYLGESSIDTSSTKLEKKSIVIESIVNAVVDSNTYYFITDTDHKLYSASIKVNKGVLPFLKNGDRVTIEYSNLEVGDIISIKKDNNE